MRFLPWWPVICVVMGTGCAGDKVACGEGTHEENGLCVPDTDTDTDADLGQQLRTS